MNEGKSGLIDAFATGYARVDELIAGIGPEEMHFVPPIRDAWSINDFLVHFLDADLSLAFRARAAIAEPGKIVPAWEEAEWRDALRYDSEDGLACLAQAKDIRAFVARGMRSVVDSDWTGFFIMHPTKGRMGLDALVEMYDQHILFHLPLIRRNRLAWKKRLLPGQSDGGTRDSLKL
jgi:hypothetical protein